jgi:hypothetical protein
MYDDYRNLEEVEDDQGRWHAEVLALEQYREESLNNRKETKMGLTVRESGGNGGNYTPAPAGAHVARCYRIVDLGTQETTFKGDTKLSHQIMISWELPGSPMDDGKPFTISQRFTASLSEKAKLRAVLESWRGRKFTPTELAGFDLQNILGKPCMINIVHVDKADRTYANIASVMQVPGGMVVPPQVNDSVFFSLESFDADVFSSLSDSTQETIKKAPEYMDAVKGKSAQVATSDGGIDTLDDDIPF